MLEQGHDRETIAAHVGVTPAQVSAVAAHLKMGTYVEASHQSTSEVESQEKDPRVMRLPIQDRSHEPPKILPIPVGPDLESGQAVNWDLIGSANPHLLILGESGFGKTYTISCLVAELARQKVTSIILDYGQGFSLESSHPAFFTWGQPNQINAGRDGIDINPLQIFPTDLYGPVNVAQRIADTFSRVYPKIGVQQHSVLRQAVLEVMRDSGISESDSHSWRKDPPPFAQVQQKLFSYVNDPTNPHRTFAASVASHVSTLFVFNTFRPNGHQLNWRKMLGGAGQIYIIELKALEYSLERAVTEFLLWNLLGFIESLGPAPFRCFAILDEAHKLSFTQGSPVEKLLREGRKFGLGLILASQQPEDFSPIAFANTATKIVFQVGDESSFVSRQLSRKVREPHSFTQIFQLITKLPRGCAYVVSQNVGRVVQVLSFEDRIRRWELDRPV